MLKFCPFCKNELDDPRLLPCGITLCSDCINKNTKNKKLSCFDCKEKHEVPKNGFEVPKTNSQVLGKHLQDIRSV